MEDALRGCRVVSQTQTPTDVVNFVRGFNFDRDDEVTLTVEGFLRSAAATTTQRYRRRRGGQNTKKEVRKSELALLSRNLTIPISTLPMPDAADLMDQRRGVCARETHQEAPMPKEDSTFVCSPSRGCCRNRR